MTIPADIAVHCGSQIHEFGPFAPAPEAEYWLNWHGCLEALACAGCVTTVINAAHTKLQHGEPITCPYCNHHFSLVSEYVTWIDITPKDPR